MSLLSAQVKKQNHALVQGIVQLLFKKTCRIFCFKLIKLIEILNTQILHFNSVDFPVSLCSVDKIRARY